LKTKKIQEWIIETFDYSFKDQSLAENALTHRSFSSNNNERLEFLGDSALDLVISELLFEKYSDESEGNLSRMRASIVNKESLSELAREINLDQYLILGQGEIKSGGGDRSSILSNALEAIIGAIFIEGGYSSLKTSVLNIFSSKLESLNPESENKDHKSLLQEKMQKMKKELPRYHLLNTEGEQHDQTFHVECIIEKGKISTKASAKSLRVAEQKAAMKALRLL
jgi:ribonuclease-3|tara:strand:+ start:1400 stop:2074 length:675 start_codon:yes stop_codon:yes gene_type:complete